MTVIAISTGLFVSSLLLFGVLTESGNDFYPTVPIAGVELKFEA
ncbi:MAG: hypothetical protein Q6K81_02715 [Gloeomargarita sp. DG02_5_bins_242]